MSSDDDRDRDDDVKCCARGARVLACVFVVGEQRSATDIHRGTARPTQKSMRTCMLFFFIFHSSVAGRWYLLCAYCVCVCVLRLLVYSFQAHIQLAVSMRERLM